MNFIYGYDIFFSQRQSLNKNYYQIEGDDSFSSDFTHTLYLNNNQYRVVSITSDKSFENLQSNQNIYFNGENVITFFL